MYVDDISEGTAEKTGTPIIVKEKVGTALVDAKNVLGPVSVYFDIDKYYKLKMLMGTFSGGHRERARSVIIPHC